jgi:hypothetical protein
MPIRDNAPIEERVHALEAIFFGVKQQVEDYGKMLLELQERT